MMQKNKNIFAKSFSELQNVRCLAVTALLIALNVAMDLLGLRIVISPTLRIGFGFLCNAAVGMLYGPVVGIMTGMATDVLGYFAGNFTMGGYFPGYTLTAMLGGLIYGLWLYPKRVTVLRVIGAKVSINLFCNILLNTFWNSVMYGEGFLAILPARVAKNAVLLPLECVLLYFVMKIVQRCYRQMGLPETEKA